MRNVYPVLVVAAVITIACSNGNPTTPSTPTPVSGGGIPALESSQWSNGLGGGSSLRANRQVTTVHRFSDLSQVAGAWSALVRTGNGASMTIHTSDLEPGAAYTVWWVVFNDPDECATSPCGEPDLFDPDVMTLVTHAAGHVIAPNGTGNFGGHLSEGVAVDNLLGGAGSLMDARAAEIHLVVRTHGPAIPGTVDDQIHTFNGGCPPNTCEDVQFAIHQP